MKKRNTGRLPAAPVDCLAGGGEMGQLLRAIDWAQTPLGPVSAWPQSLRTAVNILLTSRHPMFIWWGPELVQFYNDAYRPILGSKKHPAALGQRGRECWPEIWPVIEPMIEAVMQRGEATYLEDSLLVLDRYGFLEECYFDYAYSPVRDETGSVGGIFVACSERTSSVIGARRLKTLRDLGERELAAAQTAEQACRAAAAALAQDPHDLPFALIYLLADDGQRAHLREAINLPAATGASLAAVSINSAHDVWQFHRALATNQSQLVENLEAQFGRLPASPWTDDWTKRALVLPLAKAGGQEFPAGFMVAGLSPRLPFDDDYRGFLELAAGQLATAIANARAYEQERRRARALAEIDRAKTEFFSNVSHEFRTPLTLMLGPLEDLLANGQHDHRVQLEVIHRNSLRLLKLVNTLLDFSRLEAGRIQATYEPVDLAAYTAELASVFRAAIEKAGLKLIVDCPPLAELVYVDREMWEKIVLNLLSNAFKFTFAGKIEVKLRIAQEQETEQSAILTVRDTGTGIPKAELPHLFERFHQVRGARRRSHEGSGIGLALVQELAKLHGGTVRVESRVDRGTTFIVSIPTGTAHLPADRVYKSGAARTLSSTGVRGEAYVAEAARWLPDEAALGATVPGALATGLARGTETQPVANAPGTVPKILLADDNADMREYMRRLLSQDYEVVAVGDGRAAWQAACEGSFDLVLTDVMMPQLDGFGLLKELRAGERTKMLSVILLSARVDEQSRVEGMKAGADDYLVKPFSAKELRARVASRLEIARLQRAAEADLRASQQQLATALKAGRMGSWTLDLRGGELIASDTCKINYGRRPDEDFTYEDLAASIHPDDVARWRAEVTRAIAAAAEFEIEYRTCWPDDSVHWVLVRGNCATDKAGQVVTLAGVSLDITARKRAETELRDAQTRLEATLTAGEVATWTWNIAQDRVYADKNLARLFSVSDADADGGRIESYLRAIHEDDRERVAAKLAQALATGDYYEAEYRLVQADGSIRWVSARGNIERDATGAAVNLPGVVVDITERKLAEDALRESKSRLELTLNAAEMGTFLWHVQEDRAESDARMLALFGLPANGTISLATALATMIHPDDGAGYAAAVARATDPHGTGALRADIRVRHTDGSLHWLAVTGQTIFAGEPRRPTLMYGVVADITERKRAELNTQFLVALDKQLGALSDPVAIEQTTINLLGRFLRASHCYFAHIYNNERGVIEREFRAPEVAVSLIAEHLVTAFNPPARIAQFLRGATVVNSDVVEQADTAALADNFARLQIRAFISTPIHFSGEWVGILNVTSHTPRIWREDELELLREVASRVWPLIERARAVAAVRESEENLQAALEGGQLGAWSWNPLTNTSARDRRVLELFGVDPSKTAGDSAPIFAHVHPDDLPGVIAALEAAQQPGGEYRAEFRVLLPDGQTRWLAGAGRARFDEQGRATLVYGVNFDITERKQAEEALRENDQRKDEFLAMLAHELRNPLAPITNAVHVLKLLDPAQPQLQWAQEIIERQTQHLTRLVDDLLDVSRITRGKITLQRQALDVMTIINRAVETARPLVDTHHHQLTITTPAEPLRVEGDLTRLVQIVGNLLNNAAKYTDDGGRIQLEVAHENDQVAIRVRDNGVGLPAELLPQVFDLFMQAQRSLDRSQGGLGIGLTLVRSLVELHGGTVEAHSAGQGRGSEFTVRLPEFKPAPVTTSATTDGTAARAAAAPKLKILIVEDNIDAAESMAFLLRYKGHQVRVAHDGLAALAAAQDFQPQAILLDIGLPELDGYEVARRLRRLPNFQSTLLIALTGYGQEEDRRLAQDAGFDHHLTKPVEPRALNALLQKL